VIVALTVAYVVCFQAAAWPAIVRIARRKSSADLSVWREWLVLTGVAMQAVVMIRTGAAWPVLVSPLASAVSLVTLLAVVYRHR
jgi:hypothetical protein